MIKYYDDDFETVNESSHLHRRVYSMLSGVPDAVLHQIRFFRKEKAKELEDRILPVFRELYQYLFNGIKMGYIIKYFTEVKRLEYTVQSINETREWLKSLEIPAGTKMILSYDFQTALEMPWSTFLEWYEQFCYNGLDDICIFSTHEQWYLLYYHEDIFLFGK